MSKRKLIYRSITDKILKDHDFICDTYNRLWYYSPNSGIWLLDGERALDTILRNHDYLYEKNKTTHNIKEIVNDIKGLIRKQNEPKEPPPHYIPFNNVIYDINKDCIEEYSPDYFFINKVATDYPKEQKNAPQ